MSSTMGKFSITPNIAKKRLFIGLLASSLILMAAAVSIVWWVISRQTTHFNKVLLNIVSSGILVVIVVLAIGIVAVVWSLWRSKNITFLQKLMYKATNILFPIALILGKWLGLDEEKIKNSYIQVSNQLVRTKSRYPNISRISILAPHCLQWVHCPHKITIDVNNCKGCGKCPIIDLIKLAQNYDARLVVVTGGTIARKVLKEYRPQAVVAIACERDLTSGIQDVVGLPVIGIVNERPEGPCANTRVDLKKVEEAIRFFKQGG
jgi:hypothetical protein